MAELNHAQLTRMIWIDARLVGAARINRSDIEQAFGISTPQAALDLRSYSKLNPGRLAYSRREKCYLTAARSRPLFATRTRLSVTHAVAIVAEQRCALIADTEQGR
ncbi:MAG: hypothetical protein PHX82_04755 [Paracoccaceae bacterium]|nr:hypothetical protein [Paracoccaceae bacterium]